MWDLSVLEVSPILGLNIPKSDMFGSKRTEVMAMISLGH